MLRALKVGAVITAGFVVVFGVLGILLEPVLSPVEEYLPWVTIVLGVVLVLLGIFLPRGRTFSVRLPTVVRAPTRASSPRCSSSASATPWCR